MKSDPSTTESTERERARLAVDAAIRAKKLAPAQREWAETYAAKDPQGFADWVAAAPELFAAGELGSDADAPQTRVAREFFGNPADAAIDLATQLDRAAAGWVRRSRDEDPSYEHMVAAARLMGVDPPARDYARREARDIMKIVTRIGQDEGIRARVRDMRKRLASANRLVRKPGPQDEHAGADDEKEREILQRAYDDAKREIEAARRDGRRRGRKPQLTAELHALKADRSESQLKRDTARLVMQFRYSRRPRKLE